MSLLEHALEYLEQGLPVFPVCHITYEPLVRWKPYQTRLPEPENLIYWWKQWPNAMIGLVTGQLSGLCCIDVDVKNGAPVEKYVTLYPTNRIVETSHTGGQHLYYRIQNTKVPTRISIEQGIDIKGEGGYTILPPSRKLDKETGKWKIPYHWGEQGAPAEWSAAQQEWVTKHQKEESDNPTWVSNLLKNGAPSGRRNIETTKLVGYFAKKGMPKDVVATMIKNWNEAVDDPEEFTDREINNIIKSVYSREASQTYYNNKSKSTKSGRVQRHEDNDTVKEFNLVNFKQYIRNYGDTQYTWTVKNWLPSKTIAFMIAAPESYKTWMLLDLAVSIASGLPFIGNCKVEETGPVIIIQQEDFHGQMAQRLSTIIYSKITKQNPQNILETYNDGSFSVPSYDNLPIYLHPDRELRFDNDDIMDKLEEQIAQIKPKAVLIDPLYSTVDTDDYMTKSIKDLWRIKKMRDTYGCSFIIAHHTRKNTSGGTAREDSWGSQFLNAFLETGWQLRRTDSENTITVRRHFKTFQGHSEVFLNFDIETEKPPFKYQISEVNQDSIKVEATSLITLLSKSNMTEAELTKKLNCSKADLSDLVKKLMVEKIIGKNKTGQYYIVNRGK